MTCLKRVGLPEKLENFLLGEVTLYLKDGTYWLYVALRELFEEFKYVIKFKKYAIELLWTSINWEKGNI